MARHNITTADYEIPYQRITAGRPVVTFCWKCESTNRKDEVGTSVGGCSRNRTDERHVKITGRGRKGSSIFDSI